MRVAVAMAVVVATTIGCAGTGSRPSAGPDARGNAVIDAAALAALAPLPFSEESEAGFFIRCDGTLGPLVIGDAGTDRVRIDIDPAEFSRVCAIAHTHIRGRDLTSAEIRRVNKRNERHSAGDRGSLAFGLPNYLRGSDGSVSVLERVGGQEKVRSLR